MAAEDTSKALETQDANVVKIRFLIIKTDVILGKWLKNDVLEVFLIE